MKLHYWLYLSAALLIIGAQWFTAEGKDAIAACSILTLLGAVVMQNKGNDDGGI